jgi:F-type H+-transporting ATPase subunit gamma
VGQFNENIADFAIKMLADSSQSNFQSNLSKLKKIKVWAVGERVYTLLSEAGLTMVNSYTVPNSINAITGLVRKIQIESETHLDSAKNASVYVFYNRMQSGTIYQPFSKRLLPLDQQWQRDLKKI